MTRRVFIATATAPLMAAAENRPALCIFSKHMAQFDYDQLGKHAKQIGFDGVDLTVRAKGHVLPERAAADMPRAIETIRSHGLSVPMITTNILTAQEPETRPILSTAGRLKVPFFKLGYHKYKFNEVEQKLKEVRTVTAELVALGKEHGVAAGFHNHSGDYVGSAVWDTRAIIAGFDPKWIGYYFDPAHATIEGGLAGWKISQEIVSPQLKMVALKDFYWAKDAKGKWRVEWCPMGEGMVDWPAVFSRLARAGFNGPLTLHIEYEAKDELAAIAKDLAFVKKQLTAAYKT